ncbi:MAG: hypothetical protein O3B13_13380 [Planctomycetota bacterium]|nr:hypothetical protein [Planctomycetota bacterium]
MTTKISKILVVFVTTASIAFLGIAVGIRNMGPNWQAETQNLPEYGFTQTAGENPQWTSTYRKEAQPHATSGSFADVIAKSYVKEMQRNDEKVAAIAPQIAQLNKENARLAGLIEADQQGIIKREEQLVQALKDVGQLIQNVSDEGQVLAIQAVETRADAEQTRESGMRLSRQRIQIETEQYRLTQQKRHLLDLVYQMDGILQRLRERQQQLIDQGADSTASAPPAENPST